MIFGAAAKRYAATFRGKTFDSSSDVEGYLTKLFSSAMKEAADGETARIEALEAENARLRMVAQRLHEWDWEDRRCPFEKLDWQAVAIDAGLMENGSYRLTDSGRAALGEKP